MIRTQPYYTYDDVILIPKYSEIESRSHVNLQTNYGFFTIKAPLLSANMDTITECKMAVDMWRHGGLGVLHRFCDITENVKLYARVREHNADCLVSIGVKDWSERSSALYDIGARHFVIDIANGHCKAVGDVIQEMRKIYKDIHITAGNVATSDGVKYLQSKGADVVKVGIGAGAACKTRTVTGFGVPMFTCIQESSSWGNLDIIADGGIKTSGDIMKAFAAGAKWVMLGSYLAGTDSTPGEIIHENGNYVKKYRGMASNDARKNWSGAAKGAEEGVSGFVQYKGSTVELLEETKNALKSAFTYAGIESVEKLYNSCIDYQVQTQNGVFEGKTRL